MKVLKQRSAQSLIEYIIIVGVVMTAVYFMAPALKRGTQSIIKVTADQIGTQENAEQDFGKHDSHMDLMTTSSRANNRKATYGSVNGVTTIVDETSQTSTNTITNMGVN